MTREFPFGDLDFDIGAFRSAGFGARFRARRSKSGFQADADIRRTADCLADTAAAEIDFAERELFAFFFRNRLGRDNLADHLIGGEPVKNRHPFDFGGRHGEPVGDHLGRQIGKVNEIGNPIE